MAGRATHTLTILLAGAIALAAAPALAQTVDEIVARHIDAETGSELKISTEAVGAPVVELSDHRLVNGVLVPFHVRVTQADQVQAEVTITSAEFNVPTDDTMFTVR